MPNISFPVKPTFDKSASLALKGIAIILMLFHHCFRDLSLFSSYDISFLPFAETQVVACAYACKICVSIFAFISGYGLYCSYKFNKSTASKWCLKRYIKTFSGFWFIWVCSAIICQIIDNRTAIIFFSEGKAAGVFYAILDFLGLANLFSTPTLNGTWWYMSAAAVFILLVPLLYYLKDNLWLFLLGTIVFIRVINIDNYYPGGTSIYAFLTPFIIGAICAHFSIIDKVFSLWSNNAYMKVYKAIVELWIIVLFFILYRRIPIELFWEFHYGLFPTVVVLFCLEFLIPMKLFKTIMSFLGKHSMNIFLTHTFIRGFYLSNFTYSWKHFIAVTLVLLIISIGLSILIEALKKLLRYDRYISSILNKIV